jgi:L-lactate dehydrogenase complex protein LldF
LFFGPKKDKEIYGPEQMHIILIDNGRTKIMENVLMRESMYCIKCGACLNYCPVYKQIGGQAYNTPYNGPIGAVVSPFIFGEEEYGHLLYASTLCGKCNEVCPVNINIVSLLIHGRKHLVDNGFSMTNKNIHKILHRIFLKRKRMNFYPSFIKNTALRFVLRKNWGQNREIPVFQKQSFNEIKQEKN